MAISASLVKELRERTGSGMMECKKALVETDGDIEAAIEMMRKSGKAAAAKKAGRTAADGMIVIKFADGGKDAAMVEVNCETDFVAKTEDFVALAEKLAQHVAERAPGNVDELLGQELAGGGPVGETIKAMSGKMGENMQVAALARFHNQAGYVGAYVHHDQKQGALISISSSRPAQEVGAFLRTLAMHVVARKPIALRREEIPAEVVERERKVYLESEDVLAKPEDKRGFIVDGKLQKFFAGSALLEQPWVVDDKISVQKALEAALGKDASIEAFSLCVASA
jgi:elongation factor Ts